MDDMTTDAVAKSAEIEMNFKRKTLSVAAFNAASSGASDVSRTLQFTSPTATTDTPM